MDAEKLIYDMFVENTGCALCDSGDAYGRHWERNVKDHPANHEPVTWEIWNGSIEYTVNTYHALINNRLECNELTDAFNELNIGCESWDSPDYYGVCAAADELLNEVGARIEGGDSWNTYNWNAPLSQTLQGCYLNIAGNEYVLIQLHNGCDVRAGYTDARLFKLSNYGLILTDVYGTCTRGGVDYMISNTYDGESISFDDEQADNPEFLDSDNIELYLMDY